MILFENAVVIQGDLEEIRERILQGQALPGHSDFTISLVKKKEENNFILFVAEKLFIHEIGYHMSSELLSPDQVVWTQLDHKRFIARTIRWKLEPQDDGSNVSYHFEAKVVGGEVGDAITKKTLFETSRHHLDRLLHEFQGQMAWVVAESKRPPVAVD